MGITDLRLTQELTQYPPLIFNLQKTLILFQNGKMMKLILLCLVVAIVFAKPKGSLPIGWLKEEATNAATDAAKDVAQKETDKAVEEASHVLKRMQLGRQRASSMLQSQMANKQDDDVATMSPADYEARQEYLRAKYTFGGPGIRV